jgi:hypothetical protein
LLARLLLPRRWYPTLTLLPNKKIFIIGGTIRTSEFGAGNPHYEIYDPANPTAAPQLFDLEPEHLAFSGQVRLPLSCALMLVPCYSCRLCPDRAPRHGASWH